MNFFALLERFSAAWSEAALRASMEGGVVLLLAALVCYAMPRLSARLKCWIWRLAMLKIVFSFTLWPLISLPVLPAPAPAPAQNVTLESSPAIPAAPLILADSQFSAETTPIIVHSAPALSVTHLLFLGWLAGATFLSCGFLIQFRRASLLRRDSRSAPADLHSQLVSVAHRFSLRTPALQLSTHINVPLVTGLLKPTLLLPEPLAQSLPENRLTLIFAHELAHLRRHDLAWNFLAAATKILFWFHPLVWLAGRESRLQQEIACDQLALRQLNGSERDYGNLLLELSTVPPSATPLAAAFTLPILHAQSPLKRRLTALKAGRLPRNRFTTALAGCLVFAVALALLPWRLVAQESQDALPASEPAAASNAEPPAAPRARSNNLDANTKEQQHLYEQEIALSRKALEMAERQHKAGAASTEEVVQLQRELTRIERELADFNHDLRGFKNSFETEIALVESLQSQAKKRHAAGVGSNAEILKLERELLRLKRELANAESQLAAAPPAQADPQAQRPIQLSPARAGVVSAIQVAAGQTVKAGQILLRLDDREARLHLKAAEASLAAARAALDSAELPDVDFPAISIDDPSSLLPRLQSLDKSKLRQVLPTLHRDASLEMLLAELASAEQLMVTTSLEFSDDHPRVQKLAGLIELLNEHIDTRIEGILAGLSTLQSARDEARLELQKRGSEKSAGHRGVLKAELQIAEAKLEQARLEVELCALTAPVDGAVQEILLQPGERATPERPVILLLPAP